MSSEGKISVVKSIHVWEIDKFCVNCKETGIALKSPVFSTGELTWHIDLYPKGQTEKDNESVSIFLLSDCTLTVTAEFSFSILDNKNRKCATHQASPQSFKPLQGWGKRDFIKQNRLMDSKTNLLQNGKLTILCEVIVNKSFLTEKEKDSSEPIMPEDTDIKQNFDDFEEFLNNERFSDVKFMIEGKEFFAHKNILANRSKVFAAMFTHDMKENLQNVVEIEDMRYEVLNEIFRYMYGRKVNGIEKIAKDLYIAADKYGLEELKVMCVKALCDNVSLNNVVEYLYFADTYSVDKLKAQALDFFASNAKDVVKIPGFKLIKDLHEDIIAELICRLAS